MTTALQERIDNALTEARQLSQQHNPKAAAAWDALREGKRQKEKGKKTVIYLN